MRKAIVITFITLLMVASVEAAARMLVWHAEPILYDFTTPQAGDLAAHQTAIWDSWPVYPYQVTTNTQGLRNVEPIQTNGQHWLAVGDSFTFGAFMPNGDTYPAQLERLQRAAGLDVQVLNAGLTGFTAVDELQYLQTKGLALQPDIILLGVYLNDVSDYRPEKRAAVDHRYAQKQWLHGFAVSEWIVTRFSSYAYQAPVESHFDILYHHPNAYDNYWQTFEADLRSILTAAQNAQVPVYIIIFPEYLQLAGYSALLQERVAQIAQDTNTPVIDLLPAFQSIGDVEALYLLRYDANETPDSAGYSGDGHLSRYGYLVTARLIAERLT